MQKDYDELKNNQEPVGEQPKPTTGQPAPTTEPTKPTTGQPAPTTEPTKPTNVQPAPTTESTKPTTESTKPVTEQPAPTTEHTKPTKPTTEPVTEQPKTDDLSDEIPEEYTASSYKELISQLEEQMQRYKPPTNEELEKMRRKQRTEGIIAGISDAVQSVANLLYANKYAPNMWDAREGMSAKMKARLEKEKADREANEDRYNSLALNIAKLKDADREAGLKVWQMKQDLAYRNRQYADSRKDREDDVKFRNKEYDERVRQWQDNFNREGKWHDDEVKRWERQFKESVRQFNVNSSLEKRRLDMEAERLSQSVKQNQFTFSLGGSNGTVTLSMDKLNAQTVSQLFNTLPETVRTKVKGEPIVQGGIVVDNKPPTTEAMLIAIGANVENSPDTQMAIRRLAGQNPKKPAAY